MARLLYGEESQLAGRWVHRIAEDLRAGKVQEVIARLQRMRPKTPELRDKLQGLIAYYSEHAGRMHYDEYLRLGYGIGSGAVESADHVRVRMGGLVIGIMSASIFASGPAGGACALPSGRHALERSRGAAAVGVTPAVVE